MIGIAGTISVNILVATIMSAVFIVKRLPMNLKLNIAGMALRIRLISENGSAIPKKR